MTSAILNDIFYQDDYLKYSYQEIIISDTSSKTDVDVSCTTSLQSLGFLDKIQLLILRECNIIFGTCKSSRMSHYTRSFDDSIDTTTRKWLFTLPLQMIYMLIRLLGFIIRIILILYNKILGQSTIQDPHHEIKEDLLDEDQEIDQFTLPEKTIHHNEDYPISQLPNWCVIRRNSISWHPCLPNIICIGNSNHHSLFMFSLLKSAPTTHQMKLTDLSNTDNQFILRNAPKINKVPIGSSQPFEHLKDSEKVLIASPKHPLYITELNDRSSDGILCVAYRPVRYCVTVAIGTTTGIQIWSTNSFYRSKKTFQGSSLYPFLIQPQYEDVPIENKHMITDSLQDTSSLYNINDTICGINRPADQEMLFKLKDQKEWKSERMLITPHLMSSAVTALEWSSDGVSLIVSWDNGTLQLYMSQFQQNTELIEWYPALTINVSPILTKTPLLHYTHDSRELSHFFPPISTTLISITFSLCRPLAVAISSAGDILLFETKSWLYSSWLLPDLSKETEPLAKIEWFPAASNLTGFVAGTQRQLFEFILPLTTASHHEMNRTVISHIEFDIPKYLIKEEEEEEEEPFNVSDFSIEKQYGTRIAVAFKSCKSILIFKYWSKSPQSPFTTLDVVVPYPETQLIYCPITVTFSPLPPPPSHTLSLNDDSMSTVSTITGWNDDIDATLDQCRRLWRHDMDETVNKLSKNAWLAVGWLTQMNTADKTESMKHMHSFHSINISSAHSPVIQLANQGSISLTTT